MTCQECELLLAENGSVEEHLAACASCRLLAEDLRANAAAFESLAADPLPSVRHEVISRIRRPIRWPWAIAAAAAILIAVLFIPKKKPDAIAPTQVVEILASRERQQPSPMNLPRIRSHKKRPTQPVVVKMLTEDPDVVIYWQVESENQP
jgi:hypothetical protein